MTAILSGEATDAQIAGFAVALRAKGETAGELAALVRTMLRFAERVDLERRRRTAHRHLRHRRRPRRHRQRLHHGRLGRGGRRRAGRQARRARGVVAMRFRRRPRGARCGDRPRPDRRRAEHPRGRDRLLLRAALPLPACASPRPRVASSARPPRSTSRRPLANPAGVQAPDRRRLRPCDGGAPDRDARRARGRAGDGVLRPRRARRAHRHRQLHRARAARRRDHGVRHRPDRLRHPARRAQRAGGRRRGRERRSRAQGPRRRDRPDPRHRRVELGRRRSLVADLAPDLGAGIKLAREILDDGRAVATLDALVRVTVAARESGDA